MSFPSLLFGAAGLAISGISVAAAVFGLPKFVTQSEGLVVVYEDDAPEIE